VGLKEDVPAEDDDFEVELEAVDVVSFALPFAMGFNELEFESIPVPTTLNLRKLINNRSQNEPVHTTCGCFLSSFKTLGPKPRTPSPFKSRPAPKL
jgi:hypothetical protein